MAKKIIKLSFLIILVPLAVILGVVVFKDRSYAWVSLCVALFSLVPLFLTFEKKDTNTTKLVILAVMIALSVAGRFLFSFIPHFKPVTAMVVITGIYMGYEYGFICGAFTALISNFIFGQGPWTPFQMFAWGLIGLLAGLFAKVLQKNIIILLIFGALAGVLFSFLMDVWTTFWYDGTFNLSIFIANIVTAIPVTITYALSNVVFLFVLIKPIGKKLERIKIKYGL